MSKYRETDRAQKWGATLLNNLEAQTGKPLNVWVEILQKNCPFNKRSEQQSWLKSEYGVLQNHALTIIDAANPEVLPDYGDPEKLVDGLFQKFEHLRPLYESVLHELLAISPEVAASPRKTFVPFSRNKQFAALKPDRNGLQLALALGDDFNDPDWAANPKFGSDRVNRAIALKSFDDFNDEVRSLALRAYELAR